MQTPPLYELFEDMLYKRAMLRLVEANSMPLTLTELLRSIEEPTEIRPSVRRDSEEISIRDLLLTSPVDVYSGIAVPKKKSSNSGKFKVVGSSDLLLRVGPETELKYLGAISISDDDYLNLPGGTEWVKVKDSIGKKREFALLANKFEEGGSYTETELYELGATLLNTPIDLQKMIVINGVRKSLIQVSDFWLWTCGYDFKRDENYEGNIAAMELRDKIYATVKNELAKADKSHGMAIVNLPDEQETATLRALAVGTLRSGLNINGYTSLNTSACLIGKPFEGNSQAVKLEERV